MANDGRRAVGLAVAGVGAVAVLLAIAIATPRQPASPGGTPGASAASTATSARPAAPTPTLVPGAPTGAQTSTLPLPAVASIGAPPGVPVACAGVGLAMVLRGDASDPAVAWLVPFDRAGRKDVLWPAGYRARFAPTLEVLDTKGVVVARDGDFIDGACVAGGDRLEIIPEQPSFGIECGALAIEICTGGNATYQVREALRARVPGRDPTVVRFTTADGAYEVRFADGGTFTGKLTGY